MASAGVPPKRGSDPKNRTMSTEVRLGHCTFMDEPWAIVDCPGSVEFSYDALFRRFDGLRSRGRRLRTLAERMASTTLLMKTLEDYEIPHLVFINKVDMLAGHIRNSIAALNIIRNFRWCFGKSPSTRRTR